MLADSRKERLERICLKTLTKAKEVTAQNFCSAYEVAKENQLSIILTQKFMYKNRMV